MSASKDNATQPEQLLHYQLGKSLGEGGFGHVYQAWDAKLHRQVAIKYLKNIAPGIDLMKEARLAASLQHAAFVKVHALEQTEESQAIVMELVPGRTLRQVLDTQTPSISHVIDIVLQVAQAMQEAHAAGLVHGDLKPSNLMQEPSGIVRILDFGLAIQADRDATTSLVQSDPQGTIAYMAPEVLTGATLRPSSDIYALGVILYELLTGARPFANLSGLALAAAVIQSNSDQWPWPDHLPQILRQLVRAMTARQIERRIGSMQGVAAQCAKIAAIDAPSLNSGTFNLAALNLMLAPLPAPIRDRYNWRQEIRKWRLTFFILCCIAGAGAIWYSQPYWTQLQAKMEPYSEAKEMQLGLEALSNFDRFEMLNRAEQHFAEILRHSPQHAAASASLSLVYSQRYLHDEKNNAWLMKAISYAKDAVKFNDFLALSHIANAKVLGLQEQFESAFVDVDRALALDPNSAQALSVKIELLIQARRFEEALTLAQQGAKRFPSERIFADQSGQIYMLTEAYRAAEVAYGLSLQMKRDGTTAYVGLSNAILKQNRLEDSVQVLQDGLKIKPGAELYVALGNSLAGRGDYVGAAGAYENAVAEANGNPNDYLAWAKLGEMMSWLPGKVDVAKLAYDKARMLLQPRLRSNPHVAILNARMGLYSAKLGDNAEALIYVEKSLDLAPNSAEIQFLAGVSYEMIDMRMQALAAIAKAREFGYSTKLIEAEPELVGLRRDPKYLR
ncbi:serine/threonine-protein kinase [Undibacterium flavidum]|uniref:Protein kinase n=1 Tax=Undibacterium flavidum TaxID=2762297 RepID=A0ABR6Y867_9BURK|nr:serine/threonine-protein kinase [Undibacterium flavidum]MBC3872349.1 protein kinase [Undibacterium flavidum]